MMKRAAVLASIWLLAFWGAAALPAEPRSDLGFANPLLADVVEMTRADIPDATILAYLRVRRARLETDVTAGDLIALRQAGVHEGIVEYIASQSGAGEDSAVPSSPSTPESSPFTPDGPDPEAAPSPGVAVPPPVPPDPADAAEPEQPDPGDTGLIMGVYDPIPEGGYPCWPASLAPYDCGRPIPVSGGFVARWPDAGRQAGRKQMDSRSKATASGGRESESADRGSDRGDRGARSDERERGGEDGGRGARAGSSGRSSGESGAHGRSSGGGSGHH